MNTLHSLSLSTPRAEARPPSRPDLPVVVIGAGPVGLAAAAHLLERGLTPLILEAGPKVAASVRAWGHVRMFSPWKYDIDAAARRLLEAHGWTGPDDEAFPTGNELADHYLEPLSQVPAVANALRLNAEVLGIARLRTDKLKSPARSEQPFVLRVRTPEGEARIFARAVIDASGTWRSPNPLGADGLLASGEDARRSQIFYGIPDVLGRHRDRYAGKRVLVVGSGHSALNAVLDLVRLRERVPGTRIVWALRRAQVGDLTGGGGRDQLPARGALGAAVKAQLDDGTLDIVTGFAIEAITDAEDGMVVHSGSQRVGPVDEIIATTGFRPDLEILRELRVELDGIVEAPSVLAPLIDPNLHSCGTVPPHGAFELAHPGEPDFYVVGMKAYGRAPTFLMLTGYEQVRSVVALIDGDEAAARDVELILPETGVCKVDGSAGGCCASDAAPSLASTATSGCGPSPAGLTAASSCAGPSADASPPAASSCGSPADTSTKPGSSCGSSCGSSAEASSTAASCCGPRAETAAPPQAIAAAPAEAGSCCSAGSAERAPAASSSASFQVASEGAALGARG